MEMALKMVEMNHYSFDSGVEVEKELNKERGKRYEKEKGRMVNGSSFCWSGVAVNNVRQLKCIPLFYRFVKDLKSL